MIRVVLPAHLRALIRREDEVELDVSSPTAETVIDALEARYPMLNGTIRDHATKRRRPYVRYFVCGCDISHEPDTTPLPERICDGSDPFLVVGAIAGG